MNHWNIPDSLEKEILERDKACIYCGTMFGLSDGVGSRPSWEHIINDARIITPENIARCCRSCNASKGVKQLSVWLESPTANDEASPKKPSQQSCEARWNQFPIRNHRNPFSAATSCVCVTQDGLVRVLF